MRFDPVRRLTKLPWSIGKLVNLTVLDLDLELIVDPPIAVTSRGGKESVRYLKALPPTHTHTHTHTYTHTYIHTDTHATSMHSTLNPQP